MAPWVVARAFLAGLTGLICASCGTTSPDWAIHPDPPPTAEEIARWRSERGFVAATAEEIAKAGRGERRFANHRADSSDGKLRVVLQPGDLVGDFQHGASTTSVHRLMNASGRVLISAPSRVHHQQSAGEDDIGETLVAWFSPDGSKVLVYEYLNGCNGPPPLAILFFRDPENNGTWSVRFPDVAGTLNKPFDEGNHAECRGLLDEEILIRNTFEGVSKIRLDRLKERHPFPFTVG